MAGKLTCHPFTFNDNVHKQRRKFDWKTGHVPSFLLKWQCLFTKKEIWHENMKWVPSFPLQLQCLKRKKEILQVNLPNVILSPAMTMFIYEEVKLQKNFPRAILSSEIPWKKKEVFQENLPCDIRSPALTMSINKEVNMTWKLAMWHPFSCYDNDY